MYLATQRVISPQGEEGINVYFHAHEPNAATPLWPPDRNPGMLRSKVEAVRPPGNRVRSYLDVVAPEGTPLSALRDALEEAMAAGAPADFREQVLTAHNDCWVRFGLERLLAEDWQRELRTLLDRALEVCRESPDTE